MNGVENIFSSNVMNRNLSYLLQLAELVDTSINIHNSYFMNISLSWRFINKLKQKNTVSTITKHKEREE